MQLTLSKGEAASYLWSLSTLEGKRAEIVEGGGVRCMTDLLAKGPSDAKLCAAGVLQQLVTSPDSDDIKARLDGGGGEGAKWIEGGRP